MFASLAKRPFLRKQAENASLLDTEFLSTEQFKNYLISDENTRQYYRLLSKSEELWHKAVTLDDFSYADMFGCLLHGVENNTQFLEFDPLNNQLTEFGVLLTTCDLNKQQANFCFHLIRQQYKFARCAEQTAEEMARRRENLLPVFAEHYTRKLEMYEICPLGKRFAQQMFDEYEHLNLRQQNECVDEFVRLEHHARNKIHSSSCQYDE